MHCALFFYFVGWILIIVTRIVSTLNKMIKKIDEKISKFRKMIYRKTPVPFRFLNKVAGTLGNVVFL